MTDRVNQMKVTDLLLEEVFSHEELKDKLRKAMGGKIPFEARESWGQFVREERLYFKMRDEWIRDKRFFQWTYDNKNHVVIELHLGSWWIFVSNAAYNDWCSGAMLH